MRGVVKRSVLRGVARSLVVRSSEIARGQDQRTRDERVGYRAVVRSRALTKVPPIGLLSRVACRANRNV